MTLCPTRRPLLAIELRDHVLERCPILLATSPPVLRFGAVPDELRRRRKRVVVERLLVDGGEHRNRSPVARDQNGLAGLFELFEHSGGTVLEETAHLLRSPANARHLLESLVQEAYS